MRGNIVRTDRAIFLSNLSCWLVDRGEVFFIRLNVGCVPANWKVFAVIGRNCASIQYENTNGVQKKEKTKEESKVFGGVDYACELFYPLQTC